MNLLIFSLISVEHTRGMKSELNQKNARRALGLEVAILIRKITLI